MPIYAYRCSTCGHAKDVLQRIADPVLSVCPACGAQTFAKQLTAARFRLKGTGWYATDFKGGSAPAADAGVANVGAKTETKPEAKAEPKTDSKPSTASPCGGACACH